MNLRKHQAEFNQLIAEIIFSGHPVKEIYLHATPGAGKSCIPIIAGNLIPAGLADRLCWIVPRLTLAYQAETNFLDPFFRKMLDHNLTIRSSTNEYNPCRGQNGFVTTYQAVGVDDRRSVLRELESKKYILILDEFHHCEDGGVWHKALQPIVERAEYVIFMTGTLARGDGKKIAWTPYECMGEKFLPDLSSVKAIHYTRTDALKEKAVLPIRFTLYDGQIEYEKVSGERISGSISNQYNDTGDAIYTALNTDFAQQLLNEGISHWLSYKKDHPRSKLLIVTANIQHAHKIKDMIGYGLSKTLRIATSRDTSRALEAMKEFKYGKADILITVAMAYEGFDVKPLTHIIALTHIRSVPWIEQMIARAVRIDPHGGPYETQAGYIFAPDDPLFRRVVDQIKREQLSLARDSETREKKEGNGNGEREPDVIPIGGQVTGHREVLFGYAASSPSQEIMTVSDQEESTRTEIDRYVREFAFRNYYKPQRINAEIKEYFGKARDQMTLSELKICKAYVRNTYPLQQNGVVEKKPGVSSSRGKGRRVPTQTQPWQTKLF